MAPLLISLNLVNISRMALDRALMSMAHTPRTHDVGPLGPILWRGQGSCLELTEKFSEDAVGDGECEREARE